MASRFSLSFIAYTSCLLIPWMLILSRSVADTLSIVVGILFLIHSFSTRDWKWVRNPVVMVALAAWGWMLLVVSPFAVDIKASYSVALPWVRWILLYAALTSWVLISKPALRGVALNIGIIAILVIIDSLWQYQFLQSISGNPIRDFHRLTGPFDGPKVGIFLTKLCFPVFGIFLYLALENPKRRYIIAALAFAITCLATIILSGERTATISVMIGITTVCGLVAWNNKKLRWVSMGLLSSIIMLLAILFLTSAPLQKRAHFLVDQLSNFQQSTYGQLFTVGYKMGSDYLLTGAGLKGFRVLCDGYVQEQPVNDCNLHPHNPYIEWFAETGAVGALFFIVLVITFLRISYSYLQNSTHNEVILSAFVVGTFVVHFLPFLGTQSFFSNWPALLLWYSVSMAMASFNILNHRSAHANQ
jgi:O-antigen ligase